MNSTSIIDKLADAHMSLTAGFQELNEEHESVLSELDKTRQSAARSEQDSTILTVKLRNRHKWLFDQIEQVKDLIETEEDVLSDQELFDSLEDAISTLYDRIQSERYCDEPPF